MRPVNVSIGTAKKTIQVNVSSDPHTAASIPGYRVVRERDYSQLYNKPSINSVILDGNVALQDLGLRAIYYDTTAAWNAMPSMVGEAGAVYIYSDHERLEDEVGNVSYIPGIRIGDGSAYLIDLPFISDGMRDALYEHISNTAIHITQAEREFWSNKVSSFINAGDSENLVLSKTEYIIEGDIRNG